MERLFPWPFWFTLHSCYTCSHRAKQKGSDLLTFAIQQCHRCHKSERSGFESEKWVMPSHEWYSTWVIVYHFTSRWIGPFYATHSHTRSGVGWKWWWREPRQKSSKLVFFFFQSSFACVVFSCLLIGCTRDGRQCHWFRQGHVTFVANLWFFATKVRAISWLWAECWQQPVMPEILLNEYECLKKLQLKDLVLMLDTSRHKIIHKPLHLATLAAAESCSI